MTDSTSSTTDPETNSPEAENAAAAAAAGTEANTSEANPGTDETGQSPDQSLEAELLKFKELALRAQADFDNYRKRAAREREETLRYANSRMLETLLPVIDNFELGMVAARNATEASNIVAGFEMVYRQLQDFLKEQGVEVIDADGADFDPNLHEALGHETSDEVKEGQILRQIRKGYKLRERLLRPANVIVSSGPTQAEG